MNSKVEYSGCSVPMPVMVVQETPAEKQPRTLCCQARTGVKVVACVEFVFVTLMIIDGIRRMISGNYATAVVFVFAILNAISAEYLLQALKADSPAKLLLFLIWKPIYCILQIAAIIFLWVIISATVESSTSLAQRLMIGRTVLLACEVLVECLFYYIVMTCRLWFLRKARHQQQPPQYAYPVEAQSLPMQPPPYEN